MNEASIVVITGPPGAGKTTVSRLLAETFDPSVHIEGDVFWHFIRRGYIEPWRVESHPQNHVVIEAVAAAADTYAGGGYTVIVDGIIGPWFLENFLANLSSPAPQVDYLVLRPTLETTLERATSDNEERRPRHGRPLGIGPARQLHEQFAELGSYEQHVLDSTGQTPEETTRSARQLLRAGHLRPTRNKG